MGMLGTNSLQQPELLTLLEHLFERPAIDRPLMPPFINRAVDIALIEDLGELIQGEVCRLWIGARNSPQMCRCVPGRPWCSRCPRCRWRWYLLYHCLWRYRHMLWYWLYRHFWWYHSLRQCWCCLWYRCL